MNNILTSDNYNAPIEYLISCKIREYDIAKANINILFYKGLINKDQYDIFYNLPKMERQITIGNMLRGNKELNDALINGFKEFVSKFILENNISSTDILSINRDAVYIINRVPTVTKFDNIEFIEKNIYTSFYKFHKLKLFYYGSKVDGNEYLHVKGMSDLNLRLHEDFFVDFLLTVFQSAQSDPVEEIIELLQIFNKEYINRTLPAGYYRNFNALSKFTIKTSSKISGFVADFVGNNNINFVDISYNQRIIETLFRIFSSAHFANIKNSIK